MWIDDELLLQCSRDMAISIWRPQTLYAVLGSSNAPDLELNIEACGRDGVPILKRYGGGGTVLLHPGCVVMSVGLWVKQLYQNKTYFELINQAVIQTLAHRWPVLGNLSQKGLSDLTHGPHKVAGTSLFRSRNYLLYQASLLVDPQTELIARYLRHPSREPDYRRGRNHSSFLMGLAQLVEGLTSEEVVTNLSQGFSPMLRDHLKNELIPPVPEQFGALLNRAERGMGMASD